VLNGLSADISRLRRDGSACGEGLGAGIVVGADCQRRSRSVALGGSHSTVEGLEVSEFGTAVGCSGHVLRVGGTFEGRTGAGLASQASAQAPSCRIRPRLRSLRRFRAAVRVWSQALFFSTPR
jgi:hypothetical protein